jgi:hypothetical protein
MQLSRLNRYAGAVEFSVLKHSLLVRHLCRHQSATCQLWALLHDVHECWTGDALRPAKFIAGHAWQEVERQYQRHVMRLTDCHPNAEEMATVDDADHRASLLEMEWLGNNMNELPRALRECLEPDANDPFEFCAAVSYLMFERKVHEHQTR